MKKTTNNVSGSIGLVLFVAVIALSVPAFVYQTAMMDEKMPRKPAR